MRTATLTAWHRGPYTKKQERQVRFWHIYGETPEDKGIYISLVLDKEDDIYLSLMLTEEALAAEGYITTFPTDEELFKKGYVRVFDGDK